MLKGKCPGCGTEYYGWALRTPEHQKCDGCGTPLIITHEIRKPLLNNEVTEVEQITAEPAKEASASPEKEYCLQKT